MEIIIRREKDSFYTLLSAIIVIAAIAFLIFLYNFAGNVVFVPTPFVLFAAGILARLVYINNNEVEFEYALHSGILNIDKLINQAKRQPIIKLPAADILTFGRYNHDDNDINKESREVEKCIDCSSGNEDADLYYFTCRHNKGKYMIIFEPNPKMLSMLKGFSSSVNKALLLENK